MNPLAITRTVRVKLNASFEELKPTFDAYTNAYNLVCETGFNDRDRNGVSLHNKTYKTSRLTLPAQLAITARMKATETLKAKPKTCPHSKLQSIRLDAHSYNVWFDKQEASILTCDGRKKFIFTIPKCYERYLGWTRKSADLIARGNDIFLHMVFVTDLVIPKSRKKPKAIGIDRGINNIAVTSDRHFYGGKQSLRVIRGYRRIRSKLQSCGSHSAKRHLAKIKGKENRFRTDTNHCISKAIVAHCNPGDTLVLEDLKKIRTRCKMRRAQRRELHNWAFYQLEQFLGYKAQAKGVTIAFVNAKYTSQKCSKCGHIAKSNRKNQASFKCGHCGYTVHADLNASFNIASNHLDAIRVLSGALVNKPIAPHKG